ncbi:zinc finger protein 37-like [Aricia agestis]|uniref:zinc finger protein 37-like n=1 Tax=Aricia agestis TaxID=91739 RepID=UPI001C207436|nr:zinc finger protein 37-like [Aricia agestis]
MENCEICFLTDVNLYDLSTTDLYYFEKIVIKKENDVNIHTVCVYCKVMFHKIHQFAEKCRHSQDILNSQLVQATNIFQTRSSPNLSISNTRYYYMGPDDESDRQDYVEDDVPLAFLSSSNVSVGADESDSRYDDEITNSRTKHKKKSKRDKINKNKKKTSTTTKEGFSSRMVQETAEYTVIKLTKEQVLAEMKENETSEKYKLAPYKCERCVKGFNFEDVLQTHMEKHSMKNGPFLCELCSQYCPSAVSLRGHMKSHTTRYKCKVCHIVRLSRQHVLEHFSLDHTDSAVSYKCTQCPYTSKKRTVMQRHVRLHSSGEPHACHHCGKLYKSRESLRVHIMRHDNSGTHACGACSLRFVYAAQLLRHTRAVHERRDYYCVECDLTFKSTYTLKQHFQRAKRHRDSSSYKFECSTCGLRFVSAATLGTHARAAHGAAAAVRCGRCARAYTSAEALRLHNARAHRDTPPQRAECGLCGRTFSRASVLRVHTMRVHAGECGGAGVPQHTHNDNKLKDLEVKNGIQES